MSLETIHILLNIIMIFAALYLICIGAFTYGLTILSRNYNRDAILRQAKKVSVLIAARNEGKNIGKLLQSLYNQTFDKENFEVIIVDDHSDDDTFGISESFKVSHPEMSLKLLKATGSGKKQAISQALHAADNEVVIVTDADCELPAKWIEKMLAFYIAKDLKMLLGPVLLSPADTLFEKLQVLEHMSLIASTAGSAAIGMPVMCNGANMMYDRKSALNVEKDRTDMKLASGDDMFLMEQFIARYGSKAIGFFLNREVIVKTATMPNLKAFFRQRTRWTSKTKAYTNWKIIATALSVFLFNLSIVFFFVAGFFMPVFWAFYVLYVIMKTLIDYPIIRRISAFMKQKKLKFWTLPLEFIYPFYVVFTAIAGMFAKVRWK
ncbi:MAG: glycosyltransferase [Bacteroidales bacterium]|nr:glycosyltransferase [Bacteroidales bacterium]